MTSRRLRSLLFSSVSLFGLASACTNEPVPTSDDELAEKVAAAIIAACPPADRADEQARATCAANLTASVVLRDGMNDSFRWGAQKAGAPANLVESDTTRFNPFVWRRSYLSLFFFDGTYRVERQGELTLLHMAYQFRNGMDIGAYPYPFWHSDKKWESWQYSPELIFVIEQGKVQGALRSQERDRTRPNVTHTWNGQWQWSEGGQMMPYASLYKFLFSQDNPHVERLETAFRSLESDMRASACFVCHAPDNLGKAPQLELLNYPNQALHARHTIAAEIAKNSMPPPNELGFPAGIADADERRALLQKATEFQAAGDAALSWENQ